MSEKIHRQNTLQLRDLLSEYQFSREQRWRICLIQSITPVVEQPAAYTKFPREPDDVVAGFHSLDCLPSKFLAVTLTFFPFHFATPFSQSVHHQTVSL
jgi:hypothetical protein